MNKTFKFVQFDIPEHLEMSDLVESGVVDKAVEVLGYDPWKHYTPSLETFLQAFFTDTWRIVSTVHVGKSDIRYLLARQNIDYNHGNTQH